ncbi:DUF5682 family protein [Streptomyces sp. NPDC051018]|uniref:DUF5682 family protein n=1 Tax=Streptomyces sp. NPDC051018 TaxID=3365639 RepID=UPI00379C454B
MNSPDAPGTPFPAGGQPEEALSSLAGCRDPYLIGVRHHSPALAAAVPALLDAAAPEVLFIELPEEFAPWLGHLSDPATVPPVALAGSGDALVFLPFAEFSPELAALRWAREAGVEVVPFDLPLAARSRREPEEPVPGSSPGAAGPEVPGPGADRAPAGGPEHGMSAAPEDGGTDAGPEGAARTAPVSGATPAGALTAALRARAGGRPGDDLWDRLVEAAAPGCEPEALRRAALLVGWALRADAGAVDPYDLRREANMRRRLAERGERRAAAVIGAFHAPALRGVPAGGGGPGYTAADRPEQARGTARGPAEGSGPGKRAAEHTEIVTSLVPYSYPLLDERSGYPAGIRDPEWQHGVLRAAGDPRLLDELLTTTAVRICAAVREAGHPSGPADAREVVRMARDLATLRGLPAAGRGELAEAAQTVLTQGRLLGRGRVVATAMEQVLVGGRQGRLAPGTPRSGLGPAVEAELAGLKLPGPGEPGSRELRLDVLRTDLDRRREICLRRLAVCRVPYGQESEVAGVGDAAALTTRWAVAWSPSTAAMLDVAGLHGVTLEQAASGVLRRRRAEEQRQGGPTAAEAVDGLAEAVRCALPELAAQRLGELAELLPATGTLPELLSGMALLDRIRSGHVPGLDAGWQRPAVDAAYEELTTAGVRSLDGLAGSTDPSDARALVSLAGRASEIGGGLRLADALARLETDATPLIQGAAGAARVLLGQRDPGGFGAGLASRADAAHTSELRGRLAEFLRGTLLAAGPLLETGRALDPLLERVEALTDRRFLDRLPALRAGFDTLSPAARSRLLSVVEDRTGTAAGTLSGPVTDPGTLGLLALADLAGREALAARALGPGEEGVTAPPGSGSRAGAAAAAAAAGDTPGMDGRPAAEAGAGTGARIPDPVVSGPGSWAAAPDAGASGPGAGPGSGPGSGSWPRSASGPGPRVVLSRGAGPGNSESGNSESGNSASVVTSSGSGEAGAEEGGSGRAGAAGTGSVGAGAERTGSLSVGSVASPPDSATGPDSGISSYGATGSYSGTGPDSGTSSGGFGPDGETGSGGTAVPGAEGGGIALTPGERWRLLLGRGRELSGGARRYATALDELYGRGRGEGSRGDEGYGGSGSGGGDQPSYPGVRAWSEELAALFGPGVREEVLASAADAGRVDAAFELDPSAARPSVELLRTVLSYAGGLPEQQLARLRPLVARLVRELTEALANRLRPALTGLTHPRPTRRPGGPLDLPRTLRANLTTARRDPDTGAVSVLPERPVFRTRARRSTDWRLVLVVDVSGSMEASTIWSALTASVLAGVPALSTHFVAFSTEVLDLTDQVDDPLGLLLEVRVGGGTNIARGLRYARDLVTVPSRTLTVLISDFEEGGPVGPLLSEVRTLVDAGCHVLGCASLDNEGLPRYSTAVAGRLVAAGMPVAALSPLELARWVGERVGGTQR